jgi:DNA polymerase
MSRDFRPPKPACHLQRTTPRWAELRPPEPARPVRLIRLEHDTDFDGWRRAARTLRLGGVGPEHVTWTVGGEGGDLFASTTPEPAASGPAFTVPREFVELAEEVICHRAADRFDLLYRLLWRLAAEPNLLRVPTDPEVAAAADYRKNVAKAVHKMHAFVRFRLVEGAEEETYVAWFEPRTTWWSAPRRSSCAASPTCAFRS